MQIVQQSVNTKNAIMTPSSSINGSIIDVLDRGATQDKLEMEQPIMNVPVDMGLPSPSRYRPDVSNMEPTPMHGDYEDETFHPDDHH